MNCPRCNTTVADSHGVCDTCKENAFQCGSCRNINYENLAAFLCNECGQSKYGKFEFSVLAKPYFAVEKIKNNKMKLETEKALEHILVNSQSKFISKLNERRLALISGIKMMKNSESSFAVSDLQSIFNESFILYQSVMKGCENVRSIRMELIEYEEAKRSESTEESNKESDNLFVKKVEKKNSAISAQDAEQESMSD